MKAKNSTEDDSNQSDDTSGSAFSNTVTREVVEALCNGSHEAFETIYLHFAQSIRRFTSKLIGSTEEGEELTQNVFVKLWENKDKINPERGVKSYLFMIARNASLDYLKRQKRFENISDDYEFLGDMLETADQKIIAKDTALLIKIAIDSMPANRREVFKLHQDGLTYDEIAERLSISKDNAHQYVSRARRDIKDILGIIAYFTIY